MYISLENIKDINNLEKIVNDQDLLKKFLTYQLFDITKKCLRETEVVCDGVPTGVYAFDAKNAIAAIKTIGQINGLMQLKFKIQNQFGSPVGELDLVEAYNLVREHCAPMLTLKPVKKASPHKYPSLDEVAARVKLFKKGD